MGAGEGEQKPSLAEPIRERGCFSFNNQPQEHGGAHLPGIGELAEEQSGQGDGEEGLQSFRVQELWNQSGIHPAALILEREAQHILMRGSLWSERASQPQAGPSEAPGSFAGYRWVSNVTQRKGYPLGDRGHGLRKSH